MLLIIILPSNYIIYTKLHNWPYDGRRHCLISDTLCYLLNSRYLRRIQSDNRSFGNFRLSFS